MALSSPGRAARVGAEAVRQSLEGKRVDASGAVFRLLLQIALGLSILVLVVLIGFLSMSVYERYTTLREIAHKRVLKEEELHLLQEQQAALQANVEHFNEGRGVEEELRKRFDVAKEGEQVVVIVGEEETPTDADALTEPPGTDDPAANGAPWWHIFKFW